MQNKGAPGGHPKEKRFYYRGPREKGPVRLDSVLSSSFAHLGIEAKIREHGIRKLWEECVGANISKRARPQKLIGTVLYCTVASSPWMSELNYQKTTIINKINKRSGERLITEIVFRIGAVSIRTPDAPPKDPPGKITPEEKIFIEKATAGIKDGYLKDLIKRTFEKGKF